MNSSQAGQYQQQFHSSILTISGRFEAFRNQITPPIGSLETSPHWLYQYKVRGGQATICQNLPTLQDNSLDLTSHTMTLTSQTMITVVAPSTA